MQIVDKKRTILDTIIKRKANWIGEILIGNVNAEKDREELSDNN